MSGPFGASHVPYPFDVVIDGEGYRLLDALETLPYGMPRAEYGISPTFLPRTNVAGNYGDNQNEFWMTFSQRDWSLGEGQKYFRLDDDEAVRRYWQGTKLNVAIPGEVSIREEAATATAAAAVKAIASQGANVYFATSSTVYRVDADGTITSLGAHGSGNTVGPLGLLADQSGDVYVTGAGSSAIRKYDSSGATWGDFGSALNPAVESLFLHNSAIYGGRNGQVYRYDTAGARTQLQEWKVGDGNNLNDDARFVSLGGDLIAMLTDGFHGGCELWSYDGVGFAQVLELPVNFEGYDLAQLYGIIFIAGRFKRYRSSAEYLPAIYYYAQGVPGVLWAAEDWTTSDVRPVCEQFQNQLVFTDPTRSVLMAYNLDNGGIHTVAGYSGSANATPLMGACGSHVIVVAGNGETTLNRWPTSTVASSATLTTSLFDAESSLTKHFESVRIDYDEASDGDGGSVDVAYRLNDLEPGGSFTTIQTGVVAGQEYGIHQDGRSMTLKVTLNRGTSTKGPKLKRIFLRAAPLLDAFRRAQYVLDLSGRDGEGHVHRRDGQRHHKDGQAMATDLFAVANAKVPVTIVDRFGSFSGVIDNERFQLLEVRPEEYVAVVPVRGSST